MSQSCHIKECSNLIIWARTYTKDSMSGSLRFICDNRQFLTNHLVQKSALSNIRFAHNSHISCIFREGVMSRQNYYGKFPHTLEYSLYEKPKSNKFVLSKDSHDRFEFIQVQHDFEPKIDVQDKFNSQKAEAHKWRQLNQQLLFFKEQDSKVCCDPFQHEPDSKRLF